MNRSDSFKPAWWCPGAHTQTIAGRFLRTAPALSLSRHRLEMNDGDFLDLDWLAGAEDAPLVIVLHGLEGSSQAPYVLSFLGQIRRKNWRAAAVNFRGCSGHPNRLKMTYHSGKTEDLDFLIHHFTREKANTPIFLVGYSIGGNILLKWLGEQGENARQKVQKAAAISVPYDLTEAARILDRGFNREVYTRSLLATLKRKALHKEKLFPGILNSEKVKRCRTFEIFDREVTAPLNGFRDEKDYWQRSSSRHYLKHIRVETLLIHAEDDPFFPGALVPVGEIRDSGHLTIVMPAKGGHVGFLSGAWPWQQDSWLEKTLISFLDMR